MPGGLAARGQDAGRLAVRGTMPRRTGLPDQSGEQGDEEGEQRKQRLADAPGRDVGLVVEKPAQLVIEPPRRRFC